MSPTRLRRRTAVAVLALSLAVAGCGSDASDGSASSGSGGAETTAAPAGSEAETTAVAPDADAFPVSIAHRYGTTEITEAPERVAVVGLTEQDALLALGVVPVATTEWFGEHDGAVWPWAQDELADLGGGDITVLTNTDGINIEAVAATRPDLILGVYSGMTEDEYAGLAGIAPTIAQPEGEQDYQVSWQDETLVVAEAVGRKAEGQALVDDIEARFTEAREAHPEFAGKTAVMATPYEGVFVYGSEDPRGRFLEALGFEVPAELSAVGGGEFGGDLPDEQVELLDLDTVVWLDIEDREGDDPVYDGLAVHTEGREVFLDSEDETGLGGATSFVTVLSLPELLDGLVPRLALAVDGDPSTEVPT